MKFLIALVPFIAIANGFWLSNEIQEFEKFQVNYGKQYSTPEEKQKRMGIFIQNLREIQTHNAVPSKSFTMSVNQFSDLTNEEFKSRHLGLKGQMSKGLPVNTNKFSNTVLPQNVDWRKKGAVSEVKNQGSCGSCWAFTTIEMIESYLKINTGNMKELSTQQITSCAPNPLHCGGKGGCEGSVPQLGFTYADLFGVMEEKDYPYVSGRTEKTGKCKYNHKKASVQLRGYETLPSNDMEAVMHHLAYVGPLGVAVDASNFHHYAEGVFDGCKFSENIEINHAVQLVGYGTDPKLGDYWLIRNSWGKYYGEDGYIRIKRNSSLKCGIDSTPLMGVACEDAGIKEQKVCGTCGILFDTVYPIGVGF